MSGLMELPRCGGAGTQERCEGSWERLGPATGAAAFGTGRQCQKGEYLQPRGSSA